jgi:hypothetical protein
MLAKALTAAALALALGHSGAEASSRFPNGDTFRTACFKDDCVRYLCNDVGQDCLRLGYFARRDEERQDLPEYNADPAPAAAPKDEDSNAFGAPAPKYHYINHFDPDNDYVEYPN